MKLESVSVDNGVATIRTDEPHTYKITLPSKPARGPIKKDEYGRYITESGRHVIPVEEVDEEFRVKGEDSSDPWARETVLHDCVAVVLSAVLGRHVEPDKNRGVDEVLALEGEEYDR